MSALLKLSGLIDGLNRFIGRWVIWLILASTLISAVNAVVRKAFNYSSNAFLEVQWYLFAASFMLAAGYTLLNNEHVRIDVVVSRFSKRVQTWIDLFGFVFFSHQVGSFLGLWTAGRLFDLTKSYDTMWWLSVALGLFAAAMHWPIRERPVARLAEIGRAHV